MKSEPQKQHQWLQRMLGAWTFESEASMGPGKPREKFQGTEHVRSLGGLWIVADGQGDMPGGGTAQMMLTLGYDPRRERFVGTWVGSMMPQMWVYEGSLDAGGSILTLDTEGPSFTDDAGGMAKFQDIIELRSEDHRILTSRSQGADGTWQEFMTAHYRRQR